MFNFISNFYANYKIYIIVIAISGLLTSAFFFGYRYAGAQCEAEKLEALEDAIKAQQETEKLLHEQSRQFEQFRVENETKNRNLIKRLENEIKTDDSYKRAIPSGGLRLLSEAVASANAS
jgi:type II secretory pathway pseudopilin PulG